MALHRRVNSRILRVNHAEDVTFGIKPLIGPARQMAGRLRELGHGIVDASESVWPNFYWIPLKAHPVKAHPVPESRGSVHPDPAFSVFHD
jgi:hypothetical protein